MHPSLQPEKRKKNKLIPQARVQGQIIPNQTNALLLLLLADLQALALSAPFRVISLCSLLMLLTGGLTVFHCKSQHWSYPAAAYSTFTLLPHVESPDCEENHRLSGRQCAFILKLQVLCFGCLVFYRQRWAHLDCMLKLSPNASINASMHHEVFTLWSLFKKHWVHSHCLYVISEGEYYLRATLD